MSGKKARRVKNWRAFPCLIAPLARTDTGCNGATSSPLNDGYPRRARCPAEPDAELRPFPVAPVARQECRHDGVAGVRPAQQHRADVVAAAPAARRPGGAGTLAARCPCCRAPGPPEPGAHRRGRCAGPLALHGGRAQPGRVARRVAGRAPQPRARRRGALVLRCAARPGVRARRGPGAPRPAVSQHRHQRTRRGQPDGARRGV